MDILFALISAFLLMGSAILAGRWFKSKSARKKMIWPLRIVGGSSCLLGSVVLFADFRPGSLETQISLAMAFAITMILAGMLGVGLAGHTSAER